MVMSDCNVEMDNSVSTPQLSVGQTFSVPNSPYSIKIDSMNCSGNFESYYVRVKVYKSGTQIGTKDYNPFVCDPASCPTLFDNNNICVAQSWMDCANNKSDYRIYYNSAPTHYIDVYIQKHSNLSVNEAINKTLTYSTEIDGKLANYFTGLTGWQYLGSDVLADPESSDKVIFRVKLIDTGTPAIGFWAVIKIILILILLAVGVIVAYRFYQVTGTLLNKKDYTKEEVANTVYGGDVNGENVKGVVPEQLDQCDLNCGTNASCLANCYKSVVCGAATGTGDALKLGINCETQQVNQKIDACYTAYQSDNDWNKYKSCLGKTADDSGEEIKEEAAKQTGYDWFTIGLIAVGVLLVFFIIIMLTSRR